MNEKIIIKGKANILKISIVIVIIIGIILGIFTGTIYERNDEIGNLIKYTTGGGTIILGFLIWLNIKSYEITVTNKRVFGKSSFGVRIDIPLTKITSIMISPILKTILVSSPSGTIKFSFISNAEEVYEKINELILIKK
mgnify:CR=1 FL=1